jgi:hypothetical protein
MSTLRIKKWGAAAGIAYPILQLVSQGLIQAGGSEPPFTAPASKIVEFFQNRDPTLFEAGGYVSMVSMIVFLWFIAYLWRELRSSEGSDGFLSMVALGSGLATISLYLSSGGWGLAVFRIPEGLDPQLARTLFDEGNFNFATSWVSLGSMVLAASLVFQRGEFPQWLSWSGIVLAVGLLLARLIWTSGLAFIPYVLFWVWMITLGVLFMRRSKGNMHHEV